MTDSALHARYFDGRSARAWPAQLSVDQGEWIVTLLESEKGTKVLRFRGSEVKVEEANKHLPRRLSLPGGALLEVAEQVKFEQLLPQVGEARKWIDRAQNSWKMAFGVLGILVAFLVASYLWVLPLVAGVIAQYVPASLEKNLGDQAWPSIDQEYFSTSQMTSEQQDLIRKGFEKLRIADPSLPAAELLFRQSKVGPNAIAVPGGRIVITDELIKLANQGKPEGEKLSADQLAQEAILGVLAHELGHLKYRHSVRSLIQAAAVTAVISLWLGDVSTIVAAIPALLAQMKYSRDFESQADNYAIYLLDQAGLSRLPTAELFESMMKLGDGEGAFSSHPPTAERARKFREGLKP